MKTNASSSPRLPSVKQFLFLCFMLWPLLAGAQQFSIDWHKISGGGGTGSNGNYTITGTIGQHDAGTTTGGNVSLLGGFWSAVVAVQTPGAPQLSIQRSGTNAVLSWPLDKGADFVLEKAGEVNSTTSWTSATPTLVTNGNTIRVTVPAVQGMEYYRLHKP